MKRLFYLLYSHSTFAAFVVLEGISMLLIVAQRVPERNWGHARHRIIEACCVYINELKCYPTLRQSNATLSKENALLKERILQATQHTPPTPLLTVPPQYMLIPAQVVNNSIVHTRNYLTLDRGSVHGVAPGMGVIGPDGIVGKVKAVSKQFATVVPLLHTDVRTAAKLSQSGAMGTVKWSGYHPNRAQLCYVPRHVTITSGEAVVTSGYNAVFFEGLAIGKVKHVKLRPEASFYDIVLDLSTDFSTLQYVYVVANALREEKIQLEHNTRACHE